MREDTYIPVAVNGRTVRLRGWVETDPNSPNFGGRLFRDAVSHERAAELAGMSIAGSRTVVSYEDAHGTRTLSPGASLVPEPDGRFTVTYA